MNSKTIFAVLILLLLLGAGYFVFRPQNQETTRNEKMNSQESMESDSAKDGSIKENRMEMKEYTLLEVSQHATSDDCWFVIEGTVYDVTDFIASGNHGGGDAIIQGCGKDATQLFNDRPNGSGSHSEMARGFLPNFQIGTLSK